MNVAQPAPDAQALPALVIVTGPPGAGKTTLAGPLAQDLGLPLFSKDSLKEILYDALPFEDGDRLAWSRRLGAAAYPLLYRVVGSVLAAGGSAMVESNFHRDLAAPEFLARAASGTWHPGHDDMAVLEQVMENVRRGVHAALALEGAVIEVDTTTIGGVDRTALREQVQAALTVRQYQVTAGQERGHGV